MALRPPGRADRAVLVPYAPTLSTQLIDVRDLAGWLIECAELGRAGIVNAMGNPFLLPAHLAVARGVAGHTGTLVQADAAWLTGHDVEPWAGPRPLPLWLPLPQHAGFTTHDTRAAAGLELRLRPPAHTLADGLAWELTRPADLPRTAGLSDDDERYWPNSA